MLSIRCLCLRVFNICCGFWKLLIPQFCSEVSIYGCKSLMLWTKDFCDLKKNKQTNLLQYLKLSLYVPSSVRTYCFMHIVWPVNAKELQVCKIWLSVCAILRLMETHLLPQITELLFKLFGNSCTDAAVGLEWSHLMSDFTRHAQLKNKPNHMAEYQPRHQRPASQPPRLLFVTLFIFTVFVGV